ncbi:exported hypothetical protein [Cupriavidus taiwanensis]|nr:exported hypothetical protein [Cupriavidus taiwanensis]SOY85760.1 exported hypothetical protein [Cupriavidus taiwanensis]SPA15643.1 exported hypothetical protein [Cupriavidus taiwanensis]SPD44883.1 protein of unknown function [Cupriavidus taiwanensis]
MYLYNSRFTHFLSPSASWISLILCGAVLEVGKRNAATIDAGTANERSSINSTLISPDISTVNDRDPNLPAL